MIIAIVESKSKPGKFYEVISSEKDGAIYCSCPAWKFSGKKDNGVKYCKHLLSIGIAKPVKVVA
jgi:predicted nucleic acid-binding Zn finger protein